MKSIIIMLVSLLLVSCKDNGSSGTLEEESIQVYINSGAIQCETTGNSFQVTAQTLIEHGIDVINSTCGYITGLAVAAQCGLGDSNINIHTISAQNLPDAIELGYESTDTLPQGYTEICESDA
ncbi:hypothetical protein [Teredinibacter haidensis]|uniref:hypothetical protein n=1 Tax=Teredinibacter haidensis TaxID=2731755 RepID=UPI00163CF7E8|nr:hypothetical protein [Teredinibacter haidensis]